MTTRYAVHTLASAPEASRPVLQELSKTFGFLPNIAGAMAESPVLVGAFIDLFRKVHAGTFDEAQIQVLLLTNAVTNRCAWAVAFHSFLGLEQGLARADVDAIRAGRAPSDIHHAALSSLAKGLIERRGQRDDGQLDAFVGAGFTPAQALEAIAVIAASTITNYVGNVTQPPLEADFQPFAWQA